MKNILCAVLLFFIVVCAAFGQDANDGVISELSGNVELKHPGTDVFVPAKSGDTIAQDTIVSTGFRSSAVIKIGSSVITVRPLTRLSIAEIKNEDGAESVNVNLQAGRTKVDVKPPAGTKTNFNIQGPSSTASVRGTSFDFDTQSVNVQEGTVAFWSKYGPKAMIQAGKAGAVGADGNAEVKSEEVQPLPPVGAAESFGPADASGNSGSNDTGSLPLDVGEGK